MAASGYCPRCGTQRMSALRYCASCAYDFWSAAAGQAQPTPPPAAPTPPGAAAAASPPGRRDSPATVALLIGLFAVIGIFWYVGQSKETPSPTARPTATPRGEEKNLTGTFLRWEPVDDARGYAYFSVTNNGATAATATCTIQVSNDFGNFGFDYLVGEPVGLGETISGRVALDVGEGSYLINDGEVTDC